MRTVVALVLFGMTMLLVMPCVAEQVQPETARRAAQTFLCSNRVETNDLADISVEAGFSNLYIFTTEHSFVLMPVDDRVQPILGYSLTGGFVAEDMPDNVRWWLQSYNDQIQYVVDHFSTPNREIARQWQELVSGTETTNRSRTVVGPLITTSWNQGYPYNNFCPNGSITGCVATAMAQIMKYWNYPAHGIGWHSYTPYSHPEYGELTANFNDTYYDWVNMTNTYDYNSTNTQQQAVATLMYHCGVSVNMDYSPSASSAGTVHDALRYYFNYSSEIEYLDRQNFTDNEWIAMMRNELNASRPMFYRGEDGSVGHAFVCDGYDSGVYNNYYFHFNWGWGGWCDGYFSINNLNPDGSNFNYYQAMTIGIQPSSNNANPTSLTYTQNGRDITLHWTTASGASSYNVYCNMNLIGNVTSNSFTYTVPFGESKYYVRSVDSNGELSLSTNSVTVNIAYPIPLVNDLSAIVLGDDVNLSWTAPEWCYPQTPSATLTYGNGNYENYWGYNGTTNMYWGHRYLAADISNYDNMAIYKVSFYAKETGAYQLFVYQGTSSGRPQTQVWQQSFSVGLIGWFDIDLSNIVQIDASQDLWVFIYDPETRVYPATGCWYYSGSNGSYYSYSIGPTSWVSTFDNIAFLIRTYLTDGTYSYNIYRNGSNIASNVSATTYNDNDLTNGTYTYYVKTNYYAGESAASNSVTAQVNVTWCTINTSCEPANGGTATGGGTYYNGQNCTLTATPATGYTFVNWTKNGTQVSTNASYTFPVVESATYVAHFQLQSHTVSVSADPTSGGSVSGGGTFNHGQSCTVHATANTGYTFVNWTENGTQVSTNANYTFTVTGDRNLVAHFQLQSYTITATADPTAGGSVTGGGTYNYSASCTLTATANQGYTFVNWTRNGTQVSTDVSYTFTVTESATYVAHFQLQSYTVSVSADPTSGGSVSGGGTFNYGQSCTVHATANTGYNFVNWTENGTQVSTNANYTFTVTGDRNLVAHFQLQSYTITATADPTVGGTVSGGGTYTYGQSCTVHAMANTGHNFVNWTENGTQVSTTADYTFTVTGNRNLVAHFSTSSYIITAVADPAEGGVVSGSGGYDYGDQCTLTATANQGYTFVNWTENGTQVSTTADYTFTVTGNRNLVAHFGIESFMISAMTEPDNGGDIIGVGSYDYGQTCILNVEPYENYTFINWTENDTVVSEQPSFSFTVEGTRSFVAHLFYYDGFSENHDIDIDIYPNPVKNTLTIKASQPIKKWEIFSTSGTMLYDLDENADIMEMHISHFAPGTYVIRMTTNDTVFIRVFVKE